MILLDTNIISEMMKVSPAQNVMHWLDEQVTTHLFVSTLTIAEISYGLKALPEGSRRTKLEDAFDKVMAESFEYRVVAFDEEAANLYGNIMWRRKKLGRPLSVIDGQICAIARAQKFALATRNSNDFADCGINLINPFECSVVV